MQVIDAISEVMKREGVEFVSCYPTSPIIEAVAGQTRNSQEQSAKRLPANSLSN